MFWLYIEHSSDTSNVQSGLETNNKRLSISWKQLLPKYDPLAEIAERVEVMKKTMILLLKNGQRRVN